MRRKKEINFEMKIFRLKYFTTLFLYIFILFYFFFSFTFTLEPLRKKINQVKMNKKFRVYVNQRQKEMRKEIEKHSIQCVYEKT